MSFSDILGQEQPVGIIRQCIKDLEADSSRSYLFCGPEGVGKRLSAITLAKAINCQAQNADSCDSCPSCLRIQQAGHPDIHLIDDSSSGSIKIDDIRRLQKEIALRPYEAEKKVFIIDNAHNMTAEAANAFLKVLEEPQRASLIILISSKTALLFKTIISRCQIVKFYAMKRGGLKDILVRKYALDSRKAHFIAYFSEGRIGAALRLKDSTLFEDKNRIIDAFCLGSSSLQISDKQEFCQALNVLAVWFRDLYLLKSGLAQKELVNLDRKQDLVMAAASHSFVDFERAMGVISDSLLRLEQNINLKLLLSNLRWAVKN